jgi:hypothetical protein
MRGLQAQTSAGADCAIRQPDMVAILNRLGGLNDHAIAIEDRINNIHARLYGGAGINGTEKDPKPMPHGLVGEVQASVDDLAGKLKRIDEALNRLTSIA